MSTAPERAILYCPHCGNTSVQTHLLSQEYEESFFDTTSGEETKEPAVYHVVRCETCSQILVYSLAYIFTESYIDTAYGNLDYPKQTAFTDAVPKQVRRAYLEAAKVKNFSPAAFVVLARRTLEQIARDRGVVQRNLAAALKELAEKGELPPVLAEAGTLIRLIGNAGAHAGEAEVSPLQVWSIDDFLKAVIEYLYVAPSKITEFKGRFKLSEGQDVAG